MTRDETKRILLIIKSAYPNWNSANNDDLTHTVDVWAAVLKDDDYRLIEAGLMDYIKNDTSGFAPSPGQIRWFQREADWKAKKQESHPKQVEKKTKPKLIEPRIPKDKMLATAGSIDRLKKKYNIPGWR